MRRASFVLVLLSSALVLTRIGNAMVSVPTPLADTSKALNGILYTFSVSKDTLGIFDALSMTLTATNQISVPETLEVSDLDYSWTLADSNGKVIASGPTVVSLVITHVVIDPNQSEVLYGTGETMADIFGAPIIPGVYRLRWNLDNGLSFQLDIVCGKSKNEIEDSTGISSPIYPLRVGNRWTFSKEFVFSDRIITDDTVTKTIVGEELLNGEKWFLVRSTDYADQLITANQDGIYVYYQDINEAVLRYKYPVTMGEQYTSGYEEWTGDALALVTFPIAVDSTNETISVPAGSFQCYKYHAPQVDTTVGNETTEVGSEDMFLSNIGPVKIVDGNAISQLLSTNVVVTSVSGDHGQLPVTYALSQNYPNPFNPSTNISYQLPTNSFVTLRVHDVLGREVATLVNDREQAGTYNVKFDGANLPSGVYFCRLEAGNYIKTMKMLLLK